MRVLTTTLLSLLSLTALVTCSNDIHQRQYNTEYELKEGPLDTEWTKKVGTNPWPEVCFKPNDVMKYFKLQRQLTVPLQYPRPQRQRNNWKTLNGVWRYENATNAEAVQTPPFGRDLKEAVLVPFCLESALSG